jgi:hypothetical protein
MYDIRGLHHTPLCFRGLAQGIRMASGPMSLWGVPRKTRRSSPDAKSSRATSAGGNTRIVGSVRQSTTPSRGDVPGPDNTRAVAIDEVPRTFSIALPVDRFEWSAVPVTSTAPAPAPEPVQLRRRASGARAIQVNNEDPPASQVGETAQVDESPKANPPRKRGRSKKDAKIA